MKPRKSVAGWSSLLLAVGLTAAFWSNGCFDDSTGGKSSYTGPLLRWHFAGHDAIARATNAARFKEIEGLPVTDGLRGQMATNFARAALKLWAKDLPAGAADPTAFLAPLIRDFLTREAFIEMRGPIGSIETAIAVELPPERAAVWSTNLWQLMGAWKLGQPEAVSLDGAKGWQVKKSSAPNLLQFFRSGKWVVLGLGKDKLTLVPNLLQQAAKSQRPLAALNGSLLEASADLPVLRAWIPLLKSFPLPPADLKWLGRGESLRTEVRLHFSGRIPWMYQPWQIPTNMIFEPLTSFTAVQSADQWLARIGGVQSLGLNKLPTQMYAWSISNEIARVNTAFLIDDPTNAIRQLATSLPKWAGAAMEGHIGEFIYASNRTEVLWSGIPFIFPTVKASIGPRGARFITGGLFPQPPRGYLAPPELFGQVNTRTNLLYYDWELSDQRIEHAKQLLPLLSIATMRKLPETNSASQAWMSSVGPKLGNTITEVTQTAPQELLLVRKSHTGFTGFEIAMLSAWLDSSDFPNSITLPPPMFKSRKPGAQRAAAVPPVPSGNGVANSPKP